MVSVSEANSIILSNLYTAGTVNIELKDTLGRILAEDIHADRDFPPFNRVAMDGIAIAFEHFKEGQKKFAIEAVAMAGQPQLALKEKVNAIEAMTGAPLPANADTVIPYEELEISSGVATVLAKTVSQGQNIHRQSQDAKAGQVLIESGMKISSAEVALMASVGKSNVMVKELPKVVVISTGDELVDIDEQPLPHQIRRSNSYALLSELNGLNYSAVSLHIKDDEQALHKNLKKAIAENDVLILSGGVSKGKFDFVPKVLGELGIKKLFHRVSQKPGKPFWFGVGEGKTVFALPGNPVSTFMCFHKYIKPWLIASLGGHQKETNAQLAMDFNFAADLTYFLQVKVKSEQGKLMAYPVPGGGSGDFANLKEVDGFLELPKEKKSFKSGEVFPVHIFRI